jgi:archaellum component FlaC
VCGIVSFAEIPVTPTDELNAMRFLRLEKQVQDITALVELLKEDVISLQQELRTELDDRDIHPEEVDYWMNFINRPF